MTSFIWTLNLVSGVSMKKTATPAKITKYHTVVQRHKKEHVMPMVMHGLSTMTRQGFPDMDLHCPRPRRKDVSVNP